MSHEKKYFDVAKRAFDIGASALGLIFTAPVQAGVAVLVLAAHGRPIMFRQDRPGKDGKIFQLVKFRTMLLPDEEHATDEQRLTSLGRFLRSTSLDELPTLWNVLRGEMSLVGPRPLLVSYLGHYTEEQARRHEVRPGITGLAQVRGRNEVSWQQRFKFDVEYVERRSLKLDLKILLKTVRSVFLREGISEKGHATMTPFSRIADDSDANERS